MLRVENENRIQNAPELYAHVLPKAEHHLSLKESASLLRETYINAGVIEEEADRLTKRYIGHGRGLAAGVIWTAEELSGNRSETAIPGIRIKTERKHKNIIRF
jgi:hypothetical protein